MGALRFMESMTQSCSELARKSSSSSTAYRSPPYIEMGYHGPAGLHVLVERPMVIKPAIPTQHRSTVFLHNIDQQVFFHVEKLFIFDVNSPEATGDVVDTLQDALSRVLVPYSFAAGRLRVNEEQGRLELDCNGAGALFAGAYCESSIAELGDLRVPNPELRKLISYPANVKAIAELPLCTVQVTRFKCGGFIVGMYASHVIFDGLAASEFFHNYARIARGEKMTVNPTPDRTSLRARSPPRISYSHAELMQLPDIPAKLMFNPGCDHSAPAKHSFKMFSFTPKMLSALKAKGLEDGSISRCSSFEALTAHVWRARTRAMGDHDPQQKLAKLFVVVNIRGMLKNPPLPQNFTGNAVIAAPCVDTTIEDVCEKPFSFCVLKVQQAIGSVNEEYVRSEVDWCEIMKHGIIDLQGGMIITAWSKLPYHEVDFGWGKPTCVLPLVNDRPEYVIVLSNYKGDGGVDVFMAMDFHKMAKLEEYMK